LNVETRSIAPDEVKRGGLIFQRMRNQENDVGNVDYNVENTTFYSNYFNF